jgi:hypothetical protein
VTLETALPIEMEAWDVLAGMALPPDFPASQVIVPQEHGVQAAAAPVALMGPLLSAV